MRRWLRRLIRIVDIDDQVEACRRIFASDTRWTVVRGSDLEEGESQGLPVWSRHVGDPILESNITRRVDYALFMVEALKNDALIHEAPAIVGCRTPSALAHAADRAAGVYGEDVKDEFRQKSCDDRLLVIHSRHGCGHLERGVCRRCSRLPGASSDKRGLTSTEFTYTMGLPLYR